MWDAKRRVLKIKSLKHGIIQDKRGNVMHAVFGIDVSKTSSEVAILVNGEKVHGYTILNDAFGFNRLLGDLKTVHNPEIIFEATGVYSRRLQAFLEECGYAYTRLNPLEAKKQLDSLRVRKTDKIEKINNNLVWISLLLLFFLLFSHMQPLLFQWSLITQ